MIAFTDLLIDFFVAYGLSAGLRNPSSSFVAFDSLLGPAFVDGFRFPSCFRCRSISSLSCVIRSCRLQTFKPTQETMIQPDEEMEKIKDPSKGLQQHKT